MKFLSAQPTYFSLLLIILFAAKTQAQIHNSEVEAKININSNDRFLEVTGTAKNKTEVNQSLRYELSVIKNSGGNSSKNSQNGRFTLEPSEIKDLSKTSINVDEESNIVILLLIYDLDDNLIGKDRYTLDEFEEKNKDDDVKSYNKPGEKPEDGVVLRGIVTEQTKTKAGKDFFRYFYSAYSANNVNADKTVTVSEEFGMGRSTRIEVMVENELVFQFFAQTKDDFLRSMANAALGRVVRYLQQQEKNTANIFKY